jgi:hypothetical protein
MGRVKSVWGTALTDVNTKDLEGLGQIRLETDPILGERWYRWMKNASGGSLAADSVAGFESISESAITAAANTALNQIIRGSGTWTQGAVVGYYVRVLDDAGGAGAAPEGEFARIIGNTTTVLTLDRNLTAAVTTSDTFEIHRPFHLVASADAMVSQEVAGVLMATIANGEYGWVQFRGLHTNVNCVAAGTALAAGAAVKAGAGLVVVAADNADNGEIIGANVLAISSDTVRRKAFINLNLSI